MTAFNPISSMSMQELLDETCPICSESLYFQQTQPIETPCRHRFHRKCLNDWCERTNLTRCNCPACRTPFNFKKQLTKIGTHIRNKVRTASNPEIKNLVFSAYEGADVQAIKEKLKFMRRDGTRRKAGPGTKRAANRSLSASSLTRSKTRTPPPRNTEEDINERLTQALEIINSQYNAYRSNAQRLTQREVSNLKSTLLNDMRSSEEYSNLRLSNLKKKKFLDEAIISEVPLNPEDVINIIENAGNWVRHTINLIREYFLFYPDNDIIHKNAAFKIIMLIT